MRKILVFFFVLTILLTPIAIAEAGFLDRIAPACNENLAGGNFTDNCTICHIVQLVQNVLSFLITISVMIATLMFVYAGFVYLTAGGSPDKIKSATKIFTNVFIGLIFVLGAFLIVDTIMKTFYNDAKFGPWNEIKCESSSRSNNVSSPVPNSNSIISTSNSSNNAGGGSYRKYKNDEIISGYDSDRNTNYTIIGEYPNGEKVRVYYDPNNI